MFLPKHSPEHSSENSKLMSEHFSLLSWNIQKLSLNKDFSPTINYLINSHQLDFILLQEVKLNYDTSLPLPLSNYAYLTAPNIQTPKHIYGVLTASHHPFVSHRKLLSHSKEALLTTRKSALVTEHPMADGNLLLIANLHAINFVPLNSFRKQMQQLYEALQGHDSALIISGDFNTWHRQRFTVLAELCQNLNLTAAEFNNQRHIKRFLSHPLDHVFYRNLKLCQGEALDTGRFSDHNPLLLQFTC